MGRGSLGCTFFLELVSVPTQIGHWCACESVRRTLGRDWLPGFASTRFAAGRCACGLNHKGTSPCDCSNVRTPSCS